jgi:NTP pyrophosphatase (non-canonical NTP hydrolase)
MNKKMYFVYHVPKVKVGMTSDLGKRVFEEQGYDPAEVQILYATRSMEEASELEVAYQKSLGYKVDQITYADLMNGKKWNNQKKSKPKSKFKINVTDMTTTFPCWSFDVEKFLERNLGETIKLNTSENVVVSAVLIEWIKRNVRDSQYTKGRCYVYNKAMLKFLENPSIISLQEQIDVVYDVVNGSPAKTECSKCIFPAIRHWALERGLYQKGDVKTQYVKLQEEAGEVARAIIKNDPVELKDGIGDMVVVLTNLAHLAGFTIEDCIQSAYDVINKRKGSMINGSFVKNETL